MDHTKNSPDWNDWIKNKKAAMNNINKKYNKCFQYALTVALNHGEIEKHNERITKIKPVLSKYKWEGISYLKKDNWKKGERNNVTIALNVLYNKKEKINPGYVSKNSLCHEKQVIVLMIPNEEGCAAKSKRTHYLAIKKLSILL